MEQEKQPLRGQDIDAPQDVIELDGKGTPFALITRPSAWRRMCMNWSTSGI